MYNCPIDNTNINNINVQSNCRYKNTVKVSWRYYLNDFVYSVHGFNEIIENMEMYRFVDIPNFALA